MIRPAGTEDIPVIRRIAQETWPHAYHPAILSAEQLEYMLRLLYSEQALNEAMTKKNQHFFVLDLDGTPVGFASCTPHHARSTVTHLNKLYVLPSTQGTGAGGKLLNHVIGHAAAQGDQVIELNVNKRNKAFAFYEHHGFTIVREEVIDIGRSYVMDDYVMARPLKNAVHVGR